jgi:predicted metal-dependent enzyme (double-stranded beta helix superfamily)
MEQVLTKKVELPDALNFIIESSCNFNEVRDILFKYDYKDFEDLFHPEEAEVEDGTYFRMPVYNGRCSVFIMLWGPNAETAIHDHKDYDGYVKILKGSLNEINYITSDGFIAKGEEISGSTGDSLYADYGAIHCVINRSKELSVSLHVYNTSQPGLKGVRIFDFGKRLIGILNEKAKRSSWDIPEAGFSKIIKV